jgi:formate dehydrogenase subunit delta
MSPDKLVYMANQIGKFFSTQGGDQAVTGTLAHIKAFWDPRMRATIIAHLQAGGAGLDPVTRQAIEKLAELDHPADPPRSHAS